MAQANSGSCDAEDETPAGSVESKQIFPGYSDVQEYTQKALRSVLYATKASNELPSGDDFDYYSTFNAVRDVLDIEGKRIIQLIVQVLRHQNVKGRFSATSDSVDLEDKFDTIIDANDQILEKVGTSLDEAAGIRKPAAELIIATASAKSSSTSASWNRKKSSSAVTTFKLLAAKNTQRPQLQFKDKTDNRNIPYIPGIKSKPNALLPLDESLKLPEDITVEDMDNPDFIYPHPYHYELNHITYVEAQLCEAAPKDPLPLTDTPLTLVESLAKFEKMCKYLKTVKELAIDLEAHSYRTFQGITCLMQISTRHEDYIVDVLAIREHIYALNEVFTDPTIVKVLHGADSDIEWLQRDFNVYIVNMFDTGQAARVLQHSRFSLAHLLQIYCQVQADKQYQLADWRMRPLPDELVKYAREDTHYLLYIYDKMRNELLNKGNNQKNLLHSVLHRSSQLCSQVYRKPVFSETRYLDMYKKSKKVFNSQQLHALRDIYAWRNRVARLEDESIGYVLPNHMLLHISESLPREKQGVLACCNPIPPLLRQNLSEIHNMVMEAREKPVVKADIIHPVYPSAWQHPKYDSDSMLNCPHDLSHNSDNQTADNAPSLFGKLSKDVEICEVPRISGFASAMKQLKSEVMESLAAKLVTDIKKSFISPFQMYIPLDKSSKQAKISESTSDLNKSPWKLKPNTLLGKQTGDVSPEVDANTGQPVHKYEPPKKTMKVDTITNPTITEVEKSTSIPLSQELPMKKKKKKKQLLLYDAEVPEFLQPGPVKGNFLGADIVEGEITKSSDQGSGEPTAITGEKLTVPESVKDKKKRKRNKNKSEGDLTEGFKPFDYKSADMSIFTAPVKSDSFDPNTQSTEKIKKNKKRKFKDNKNKSLTFKH